MLLPSQRLLRKLDPNGDMDNTELGPIADDLHVQWVCIVIVNERQDDECH